MIAQVIVDIKAHILDKTFDYLVPTFMEETIEVGMRVIVGFANREVMGFVVSFSETSEYASTLKEIQRLLDLEVMIPKELIELAGLISKETSTPLAMVFQTMLPSALKANYKVLLKKKQDIILPDSLQQLFLKSDVISLTPALSSLAKDIKQEIRFGNIEQIYDIQSKSKALVSKVYQVSLPENVKLSQKQQIVIDYLNQRVTHQATQKEIMDATNLSVSVLSTMVSKGLLIIAEEERYREVETLSEGLYKDVVLNSAQQNAYDAVYASFNQSTTFLLHGVTGSGKTEIYIKLMEEALRQNRQVLFLVPEISLTPMMIQRFKKHFENEIAVLHSALSIGEKYDEWRRIIRQEASVVIGARSACFAPLSNIGIIIVDECHESTYKQDEMPAYYAIDVLVHRAQTHQCPILLGSATPNIESYARVKRGYYQLLELPHKALNAFPSDVEIIDMKQEFKKGNTSLFSTRLEEEIKERLERKEQTLLLLNRRGYSNFVICRNCGHVFTCPDCDISLTYHEVDHSLKCHYCNHKEEMPKTCSKCSSTDLAFMGSGTQRVESELARLFPTAKVVRMDNDTTRTKNAHEKLLKEFEDVGDILLGTQMIAKGLDFPKVTLVGILQADGNLYSPDFRAPEKTFQLILQVSGRTGRHDLKGKVVVQAFNPNHYAISYAVKQDYLGFYDTEMRIRKIAKYSPFYFINEIILSGESARDVFLQGREVVKFLRSNLSTQAIILGPALPIVSRIQNRYRAQIIIKYRKEDDMERVLMTMREQFELPSIGIHIDRFPTI